jgi:hypothetical protein
MLDDISDAISLTDAVRIAHASSVDCAAGAGAAEVGVAEAVGVADDPDDGDAEHPANAATVSAAAMRVAMVRDAGVIYVSYEVSENASSA